MCMHTHTQTSTQSPAMENSCIGLCYPEAEEGILTFPSLQATSDPCLLPPDWRLKLQQSRMVTGGVRGGEKDDNNREM